MSKPVAVKESPNPVGKPTGTRSFPELYDKIIDELTKDKVTSGNGLSANAIAKKVKSNDMTVRLYLEDLMRDGKVSMKTIHSRMILYRLPRAKTDSNNNT